MTTPYKDAHTAPGGDDHIGGVNEMVARLRHFNAWRRDHDGELERPSPRQIGEDIDAACNALETLAGEVTELNALFDLQYTSMAEATQLWRRETGNKSISP